MVVIVWVPSTRQIENLVLDENVYCHILYILKYYPIQSITICWLLSLEIVGIPVGLGQLFTHKVGNSHIVQPLNVRLSLVGFYGTSTIVGCLMLAPIYTYIFYVYMIWFGWVLWHINHCRLFNADSSLYIYIEYIWFGWVLWHINHYRLFNAKSSLYIYIKYIVFDWVGFYGISTIVCYLRPNPLYK